MSLLERFFSTVGSVVPCIDEGALLGYWREVLKDKTRVIPRTAYALVNIMMAHASATLPDGNPILFYRRSWDHLDMQTVQSTNIDAGRRVVRFNLQRFRVYLTALTVQALLLLSIFQQNHQRSIESWTTHSLLVKAALQLGIHSPAYYEVAEERRVHKKLWYGIINQDR